MALKIRKDRTTGGRKLTAGRAASLQLMEQGYSTREAVRIVGTDLRTGRRWRRGRAASGKDKAAALVNAVVPLPVGVTPFVPSRYLAEAERVHTAGRLREKASIRQTAAEPGRSPSIISRKIRRNRRAMPKAAAKSAGSPWVTLKQRRTRPRGLGRSLKAAADSWL